MATVGVVYFSGTGTTREIAGAAFTVCAKVSGDKLNFLQDINTYAMQMGMVWVGTGSGCAEQEGPNGFYLGVGATAHSPATVTDADTGSAALLGQRVAKLAAKLT